ncbi:hypothetical protein VitviT2T_003693 [Vitis vinifera]|uniref:MATH domain-containing protein n=1 Tax=Vitis vinifera TaxID=29760 RepID=A0ABY9BNH5_VITVI|nr:hypothetical protein VitviT2T_003693 [Vitis vinifera]
MSVLLDTSIEKYESGSFEVGGYKWRLCLYPNGNKKSDGDGHISLYLVISDTQNLPLGWEVTVSFKLFVFNHIHEEYLTVQGSLFYWIIHLFYSSMVKVACTNGMHSFT